MRILADEGKIAEAQKAFEEVVAGVADERRLTDIRHPHGHLQAQVYWVSSAGLWAYFGFPPDGKSPGKRYWNAFGLEKPSNSVSIMCEINPPVRGVYRRSAGAFADAGGELYVLHRGYFNAFRGRIPNAFTYSHFNGAWIPVTDEKRKLLQVGKLSDHDFVVTLGNFVAAVGDLKSAYKAYKKSV